MSPPWATDDVEDSVQRYGARRSVAPWATDDVENAAPNERRSPSGAAPRGSTSSMKNILYGGQAEEPTKSYGRVGQPGPRQGASAPWATYEDTELYGGRSPAQRGRPAKQAGDKGNKFSTGAEKVGAGHNWDAAQMAFEETQEAAHASRVRQQAGGMSFGDYR
mmetsp:Transcript_32466/g.70928  ORF Transcript_32466/g.70928 Transcript_32466/m.70928 type:complete len:163 (-) Transcript_32466:2312-2800(-)